MLWANAFLRIHVNYMSDAPEWRLSGLNGDDPVRELF